MKSYTVWTKRDQTKQHCVYKTTKKKPRYIYSIFFVYVDYVPSNKLERLEVHFNI